MHKIRQKARKVFFSNYRGEDGFFARGWLHQFESLGVRMHLL